MTARRAAQASAGLALSLAGSAFLWTFLYTGVSVLRSGDRAPLQGILSDDILGPARHALERRSRADVQLNAGIAALGAVLAVGGLAGFALHRRPSPLGSAAFMTTGEAASAGFLGDGGLFFGRQGGVTIGWSRSVRDPRTGARERVRKMRPVGGRYLRHPRIVHAFVTGPTRSGKGTSLIITNALMWPHSLIVLDIRGETFEATAGHRARFSKVFKFAPAQAQSHGYNPLDFVRDTPGHRDADIRAVAASLVPSLGSDEYWTKDARELVAGAISYVLESEVVPDKTLASVVDVLQGQTYVIDRLTKALIEEDHLLSDFTRRTLLPFLSMPEKQFAGLYGNLRVALQPYANPYIARATSFSSFDIRAFRREPTTLYIDFRLSQAAMIAPIVNLLLSQTVDALAEARMKPGERPILMLLDEFSNLGRLEPVLSMWKVLAGNGVGVWAFVQSLTDVDRFYGKDGRNTLLDNSDLQIFLGSQSPDILEHFERLLGRRTVRLRSRSMSGSFMSQSRGVTTSEREVAVPLMSQDELRRMPDTRFVVLPMGQSPILARKNYFFADAGLRRIAGQALPKGWTIPDLDRGVGRSVFAEQGAPTDAAPPRTSAVARRPGGIAPGSVFLSHQGIIGRRDGGRGERSRPGAAFRVGAALSGRRSRAQHTETAAVETPGQPTEPGTGAMAPLPAPVAPPLPSRCADTAAGPSGDVAPPDAPAPDTIARLNAALVADDDVLTEAMAAVAALEQVEATIPDSRADDKARFRTRRRQIARLAAVVAAPEAT